jgi:hypothetical protein
MTDETAPDTAPPGETDAPIARAAGGPPFPIEYAGEDDDPWFREENRLPEMGSDTPGGLTDLLTPRLLDTARQLLIFLVRDVWGPASLALQGVIWQWKKFEILDLLRPTELVLRRMLLIEAVLLAGSQTLPPPRPSRARHGARRHTSRQANAPDFDPVRPESWSVSFNVIPGVQRPGGPKRRLPPVWPDRPSMEPDRAGRWRRKLHVSLPIARRLEAVIRVINNPVPFVRRLAFRLRRSSNPNVRLLVIPRRPRRRPYYARDALALAGERAAALLHVFWSSS